ncbi:MAG: DinB family protein [Chloroflexi bacterium]|nr:DinB family protein [Chloroflexota bacterium]
MTTDQGQQQEVAERVRSYIQHQASKGPDGIRNAVQKGHDQLTGLLEGLSDEQAEFKPAPEEWCVLEVLRHVAGSKRGVARRCATMSRGEASSNFEPDEEAPAFASLGEAREALDDGHQALLAVIATLTPETSLEARYDHPFFGPLNSPEWAAFQRVHDGDHAQQIEQIKSATGFPA